MAAVTQSQPAAALPPQPQQTKETFHFINEPTESIHDACRGLTYLQPSLRYNPEYKIVYRDDVAAFAREHVTTIGFAGGGHEPMFGGFVGDNFLSAYVSGNIFASPTAAQIFEAIKLCQPGDPSQPSRSRGTLVVCGNYTGDILNAGLAITRAQAAGYRVRFVPVGDDVAVGRKKGGKVGRRGLSGHLVALKSACAMAERGESLERVTEVMEYVAANVGTIGVAFDRVALPNARLTDLPNLPPATIELGMGAHGEPGLQQLSPVPTPEALTARMLDLVLDTNDLDRAFIPFSSPPSSSSSEVKGPRSIKRDDDVENAIAVGDGSQDQREEVVLLVNSLGSTSDEVLARFAELAVAELEVKRRFKVVRLTLGPLMTSLKMSGFGFTGWRLPSSSKGDELLTRDQALDLWDSRVDVVAWRQ